MDSFHHKVMENDFLYGKDQGINLLDKKSLEINRVLAQLQIWFFRTRPPPGYKWTITAPACKKSLPWGAVQGQSAVMYYRKWTSYCAMTRTEPLTPSLHLPLSSYPVLSLSLSACDGRGRRRSAFLLLLSHHLSPSAPMVTEHGGNRSTTISLPLL